MDDNLATTYPLSDSHNRGEDSSMPTNLRASRSRKDRPCDACRRLKHSCRIIVRGQPCVNCQRKGKSCTFEAPTRTALQKAEPDTKPHSTIQHDLDLNAWPISPKTSGSPRASATYTSISGGPSSTSPNGPLHSGQQRKLSKLLAAPDESDDSGSMGHEEDDCYASLDMDVNDVEESHYLGSCAFMHLALDRSPSSNPRRPWISQTPTSEDGGFSYSYRQVADPSDPVFFLRNPSKVYGLSNAAYAAEQAWEAVHKILISESPELPSRLYQYFMNKTLPAIPIIDRVWLDSACQGGHLGRRFPHTVLVGALVHSAVFIPSLRHRCTELWSIAVNLLDNEYRQPRLQTLQLALLEIYGWPVSNPGGTHIAISRAVGLAQLLGLHRNSAHWKLPRWERSIRKRMWWSLYIADKWNSFQYGRPSNISNDNTIPLPCPKDDDWRGMEQHRETSVMSFVGMCRLTTILDPLLPLVETDGDPDDRRRLLQDAATRLETEFDDLDMESISGRDQRPAPPGQYSFRLCHMGVTNLVCKLSLALRPLSIPKSMPLKPPPSLCTHTICVVDELVTFLENLDADGFTSYWMPWAQLNVTRGAALLLKLARRLLEFDDQDQQLAQILELLDRLVMAVLRGIDHSWQVAEGCINLVKIQLKSATDIPGTETISRRFAPVLGLSSRGSVSRESVPVAPTENDPFSFDQVLGFALGGFDDELASLLGPPGQDDWTRASSYM